MLFVCKITSYILLRYFRFEPSFKLRLLHKKWSFPLRISSVNVTMKKSLMENFIFCAMDGVVLNSLIVRNRRDIWWFSESNGIQTHSHFVNEHLTIQPCWPVCLCDPVLVYKLNGWGFESHCNILFKYKNNFQSYR